MKTRWNRKSKIMLLEQLEMYVSAGLSLGQTLRIIANRTSKKQAISLDKIAILIDGGQKLSTALASEIKFSMAVSGLISCGESSGSLSQAIKASHLLLEGEDELIKKIMSAMTYPIVIGLATIGLTVGLIQGVMPQIMPLLSGLRVELPLLTRVVMFVSGLLINYGLICLIAGFILVFVYIYCYRKFSRIKFYSHNILVHLPIVGRLAKNYHLALFFQSFGTMVESGIQADQAYEKTARSVNLLPLHFELEKKITTLRNGEKYHVIAESMPIYVGSLISAGEASGSLGHSLMRVSEILNKEISHMLKKLTALIEPCMMIGMGGIVGSIALSIMMPIYDISKTLQR